MWCSTNDAVAPLTCNCCRPLGGLSNSELDSLLRLRASLCISVLSCEQHTACLKSLKADYARCNEMTNKWPQFPGGLLITSHGDAGWRSLSNSTAGHFTLLSWGISERSLEASFNIACHDVTCSNASTGSDRGIPTSHHMEGGSNALTETSEQSCPLCSDAWGVLTCAWCRLQRGHRGQRALGNREAINAQHLQSLPVSGIYWSSSDISISINWDGIEFPLEQ